MRVSQFLIHVFSSNKVRSGFRSRCRITISCARVYGRNCATEAYLHLPKRDLYYPFVTSSTSKFPGPFFIFSSILLSENNNQSTSPDDPIKVILAELGGVPYLDNEELKDARETAITLELTNRFAFVDGEL